MKERGPPDVFYVRVKGYDDSKIPYSITEGLDNASTVTIWLLSVTVLTFSRSISSFISQK